MSSTYQLTTDCAKFLQSFIDQKEFDNFYECLLDSAFWHDIMHMPSSDKYLLINEAISALPISQGELATQSKPLTASVAFLLMSVDYEPIDPHEVAIAQNMASMCRDLKNAKDQSVETKISVIQEVGKKYREVYNIPEGVNVGTLRMTNKVSDADRKHCQDVAAFHMSVESLQCRIGEGFETDIDMNAPAYTNIVFMHEALEKASVKEGVLWLLHEMRHVHQLRDSTPEFGMQKCAPHAISKRVNKHMHKTCYYALMEERQAYAFERWFDDILHGRPVRSELQIACDNLWYKGTHEASVIDAVHDYYHYSRNHKALNPGAQTSLWQVTLRPLTARL